MLGLTVVEAQNAVINELAKEDIMVVLDNHVSLPKWCCGDDDGNAFFGDEFFDPDEWVQGLVAVASRYKGNPTV
ncbi:ricin B, lectin domain, glycoside hydrolase [Tanacetum coccineum]